MGGSHLDAAGVPIAFLQSYPFPAFVVRTDDDSPAMTPTVERCSLSRLGHGNGDYLSASRAMRSGVVWGNVKWDKLLDGKELEVLADAGALRDLLQWVQTPGHQADREGQEDDIFSLPLALAPPVTLPLTKSAVSSSSSHQYDSLYVVTALSSGVRLPLPTPRRMPAPAAANMNSSLSRTTPSPAPGYPSPLPSPSSAITPPTTVSKPGPPHLDCRHLLNTTDWAQTPLGPRSTWSPVIETMLGIVFASPTQDSLWLGSEFNMIYNQHYTQIVDHPTLFGKSAKVKEAWGPVWDGVYHLIDRCLTLGEPTYKEDDLLLYRRGQRGQFLERYHTWSFIPIFDPTGKPLGLYNPTSETTAAVLARRRQETMRDLSEELLVARNTADYFASVSEVLERNTKDVPFAITYSIADDTRGALSMQLESSIGVPDNHPSVPAKMSLQLPNLRSQSSQRGSNAFSSPTLSAISNLTNSSSRVKVSYMTKSWPIATALATRQCVLVDDCSALITGFPLREWDEMPYQAIVIPICSELSTDTPRAVMIMGLNYRCPLDTAYEDWIHVLRAHLVSSLASARASEEEKQRVADIDRMARAKTAYFQSAAHELRTPLTLVAGPIDDMLQTPLTASQNKTLTMAQRNLRRIQRLVNALLDFSRLEAGKLTGHFYPVHLGQFVGDLAALFGPGLERRNVAYSIDIQAREKMVFVDPALLETAVTNLISNAVKYTAAGRVDVRVSYSDSAFISVTDTGCGIPANEVDTVTDRFNRASNATRAVEGTGIGLALTKEIVKLHGGELLISSRTVEETGGAHGSTFTIVLPLVERETAENGSAVAFGAYGRQMVEEVNQWAGNASVDVRSEDAGSLNGSVDTAKGEGVFFFDKSDVLLLVDDTVELRRYIKSIFAPHCTVVEAANGVEALEYVRHNPVQLILSDLMMPKMSGDELLAEIRSDPTTASIPMVLLSAATDEEVRLSAIVAGAEDFILKPFRPKELLARIHLHMQLGKRRRELERLFMVREHEIRILSDLCPTGIIRTNEDGLITYGNNAWKAHAGMKVDDDPLSWPQYLEPNEGDRLGKEWLEVLEGDARESTLSWTWANGKSALGTFIRLDKINSSMAGVLGCIQDTSYQEERIREAEARRLEAEESKRQQDLLVDFTSHEIRTPVSAILQCSSLVRDNLLMLRKGLQRAERMDTGFIPSPETLDDLDQDLEALEIQERIAADVLSLARIQLDMLTFDYTDTDLRASAKKARSFYPFHVTTCPSLIQQVVSVFSSEAKAKQIELVLEFGKTLDITGISSIKTDHVRLGQVITNLVSNALKFTADSERRRITVRYEVSLVPPHPADCVVPREAYLPVQRTLSEEDPVWLFVAVQDTGPGLSPSERAVLFQRFSQGSKMVHSRFGGSGLGLYICKRISELLGGKIDVQSSPGQGSTFTFYIQAGFVVSDNIRHELADSNVTQSVYGTAAPQRKLSADVQLPAVSVPSDQEPKRARSVLVVEDNLINQTVLKRQMVKAGWTCDVASDGQEALQRIEAKSADGERYDAVLMDLEMPVMDGLTAVSRIRQDELDRSPSVPPPNLPSSASASRNGIIVNEEAAVPQTQRQLVIALTGNARQAQIDQALAAGMDDVVIKPYKLKELLAKLDAATHGP